MNWTIIGLVIIIIFLLYILYAYVTSNTSTLSSSANLNKPVPAVTVIPQSNNTSYAYGVWIYVNNLGTTSNIIFYRPQNIILYLDNQSPTLHCAFATSDTTTTDDTVVMTNFPIQKWCQIIVNVDGQIVDYYINGKLIKSEKHTRVLGTPPNIDKNPNTPIYLGNSGGYSNTTYPKAISSYKTVATSTPFDAVLSKFVRWINTIDPETAWNSYLSGNGQSAMNLSQYNAQLAISQNNITQATYSIF
jgi:hypothetical protein